MYDQQPNMTNTPPQSAGRRLYKSRRNKMIDGVCGGLAEYFEVDPTIVRILWVLITLAGGSGFFLYIAAMIIMTPNPEHLGFGQTTFNQPRANFDNKRFWGILFILVGAFILIANVGLWAGIEWWDVSGKVIFPVIIILAGIVLILVQMKNRNTSAQQTMGGFGTESGASAQPRMKELRRSITEKKIFGVCGGIANYFDLDPTLVRIAYLALVFASFGWGLILYIILGLLMPEEKLTTTL